MGTGAIASRSITEASIKVFKLHTASLIASEEIQERRQEEIKMYPMMDGVYTVSTTKDALRQFLYNVFTTLGEDIIDAEEIHHVLAVKAAVAYGPIIEGGDMDGYNDVLDGTEHQDRTIIGIPVIQAFLSEKQAPPFGVYIHESARAFAPDGDDPFNFVWWKWFRSNRDEYNQEGLANDVLEKLEEYYSWSRDNSNRIDYDEDRIEEHEKLVNQYFPQED